MAARSRGAGSTTTWLRPAGSMASYPALIRPTRVFATVDLAVHAMETSPGSPESSSPPQPRSRGGGPREATWSRARCPNPGRAAFPSPDLSAARRELQVLLCDSIFLGVHHLRVQVVINYGLLLVREVLRLLRCSLLCLELGTSKSSLALYLCEIMYIYVKCLNHLRNCCDENISQ